jgi:hypothetical protein
VSSMFIVKRQYDGGWDNERWFESLTLCVCVCVWQTNLFLIALHLELKAGKCVLSHALSGLNTVVL